MSISRKREREEDPKPERLDLIQEEDKLDLKLLMALTIEDEILVLSTELDRLQNTEYNFPQLDNYLGFMLDICDNIIDPTPNPYNNLVYDLRMKIRNFRQQLRKKTDSV